MDKQVIDRVQEIDASVRSEVRMFNNTAGNIFDERFCVVMEPAPLLHASVFGVPNRATEHRLVYMKKGEVRLSVDFEEHVMLEGDILVVPARHVVYTEHRSEIAEPWMLVFGFDMPEEQDLVGIEAKQMALDLDDRRMVEDYFHLMRDALARPIPSRDDFRHLVLSLLCRLRKIDKDIRTHTHGEMGSRAKRTRAEFVDLVVSTEPPVRHVAYYAERLNVSENYLSIIIKQETGRTVLSWVEEKINSMVKAMLASPDNFTLEQIALRVGYSTGNQVSRLFRKMNGMGPQEYRKAIGGQRRALQGTGS